MSVPGWGESGMERTSTTTTLLHHNNYNKIMYQPRFQGSLPPVPAEREEGWKREPGNEVAKVQDSRLHTV